MKKLLLLMCALSCGICSGMQFSFTKEQLAAMPEDQRAAIMAFLKASGARPVSEAVESETLDPESLVNTEETDLSRSQSNISNESTERSTLTRSASAVSRSAESSSRDSGGRAPRVTSPRLRARTTATDISSESDKRSSGDSAPAKKGIKGAFASLSKLTGRRAQSEVVERQDRDSGSQDASEERKSPRSPRPSGKELAQQTARQKEELSRILEVTTAAAEKLGRLSDKQFAQILKKAADPELIGTLCEWVIVNAQFVSVTQFRSVLDELIKLSGVDFSAIAGTEKAADKKGALSFVTNIFAKNKEGEKSKAFFQQVLIMAEQYSLKLAGVAQAKFTIEDSYRELADIFSIILNTQKTGAEAELCLALRAAIGSDDEKEVLVNMLVKMLLEALPEDCDLLKDQRVNLKDAQVIGAFVMKWAGKLEDELIDEIVLLARGLDARLAKKEQCCVALLKEWAEEPKHLSCITRYCSAQISGDVLEVKLGRNPAVAKEVLKKLTLFLRKYAPQPAVTKLSGGGLAAQVQGLKDTEDNDTTFTRLRKKAQEHRTKHGLTAPGEKPAKKAPLSREEVAYEKARARLERDDWLNDGDIPGSLETCHLCQENIEPSQADGNPLCAHECSMCWVCKKPLEQGESIRANARQECQHKLHKDCCSKVNPRNTNSCGVCKTLIQPHAQLRLAYKAWESNFSVLCAPTDDVTEQGGSDEEGARNNYAGADDDQGTMYEFGTETVALNNDEECGVDPEEMQELREKALAREQAARVFSQRGSGGGPHPEQARAPIAKKALPTPPATKKTLPTMPVKGARSGASLKGSRSETSLQHMPQTEQGDE